MMETLTTRDKVTEFEFATSNEPVSAEMLRKDLASVTPFSSIGLNLGVRYNF